MFRITKGMQRVQFSNCLRGWPPAPANLFTEPEPTTTWPATNSVQIPPSRTKSSTQGSRYYGYPPVVESPNQFFSPSTPLPPPPSKPTVPPVIQVECPPYPDICEESDDPGGLPFLRT